MVAHSEQIPAQLGLMQFALRVCARTPRARSRPATSCSSTTRTTAARTRPTCRCSRRAYDGRRCVGYTGSIAHHIDVGGRVPGTESAQCTELFQEGLLFPPVKLVEARPAEYRALYDLIAANVRDPDATLGDLDAQLAACRRGSERIAELCSAARAGDRRPAAMARCSSGPSERAAAEFRSWPGRAVSAEGYPRRRRAQPGDARCGSDATRARASAGRSTSTSPGPTPRCAGGVNVPWASTHAGAYFAVRCFVGDARCPRTTGSPGTSS